jgi:Ricin-type beta-trefoil lectin domain/Bacterial Ig-like domain (group 2)
LQLAVALDIFFEDTPGFRRSRLSAARLFLLIFLECSIFLKEGLVTNFPPDRLRYLALTLILVGPLSGQAQSLTSLTISPSQASVAIGATTQLKATAGYSDGSSQDVSGSVAWSSADPRQVKISSSGAASGQATATVAVTASYQGQTATAAVNSSIGSVQWSGPIVITQGGTYSGNWKSTEPGVAAVTIATAAPVIIQNSYMMSPSDLISDPIFGSKLTVKNVVAVGVNPNVLGLSNGIFVDALSPALLDVENSYFENVLFGVLVRGYGGNADGTQTITILNNRGRNTLGTVSDGNGGYLSGETNWQFAHTFQISNVNSVPGMRIAWNELINYPGQSLVNEVVNIFDTSGTANSPLLVHDNFIQGAYPYNPTDLFYNGGGYSTDGTSSDTPATATAFNSIYNNQIVGTVNVGIEIGTGHDNVAYNNRVLSSGLLPNGTQIPSQNGGLSLYDVYGNVQNGSMYNNNMYNNSVGWMCWAARCAWDGYRNDDWFPMNNSFYWSNQPISANPITLAMEADEYTTWLAKTNSSGMVIGPNNSALDSNPVGGSASGAISSTAWYAIVNTNSNLCLDAGGILDGTQVVQDGCVGTQASQEWQFRPMDSGYYQVVSRPAQNEVWDVNGGIWAIADSIKVQLWNHGSGANQQWMPVSTGNGTWKFVVRHSSKCLDVPGAVSTVGMQVQQYDCNGTVAQSFTLQQR